MELCASAESLRLWKSILPATFIFHSIYYYDYFICFALAFIPIYPIYAYFLKVCAHRLWLGHLYSFCAGTSTVRALTHMKFDCTHLFIFDSQARFFFFSQSLCLLFLQLDLWILGVCAHKSNDDDDDVVGVLNAVLRHASMYACEYVDSGCLFLRNDHSIRKRIKSWKTKNNTLKPHRMRSLFFCFYFFIL